jgi:hypothetical protein
MRKVVVVASVVKSNNIDEVDTGTVNKYWLFSMGLRRCSHGLRANGTGVTEGVGRYSTGGW